MKVSHNASAGLPPGPPQGFTAHVGSFPARGPWGPTNVEYTSYPDGQWPESPPARAPPPSPPPLGGGVSGMNRALGWGMQNCVLSNTVTAVGPDFMRPFGNHQMHHMPSNGPF